LIEAKQSTTMITLTRYSVALPPTPQRTQVPAQLQLSRPALAQSTHSTSSSGSVSTPSSRILRLIFSLIFITFYLPTRLRVVLPGLHLFLATFYGSGTPLICLSIVYLEFSGYHPLRLWTHTHTSPPQIMTMPPPHNPNAHVADVEDAERRFHVPATSLEVLGASDDVAEPWKHFSASFTSAKCFYTTSLHPANNPTHQEAQEVPKLTKGAWCTATKMTKLPPGGTWCQGATWNG